MSYEMIALLMFSTMMLMLLTGKRVFGAIGFVDDYIKVSARDSRGLSGKLKFSVFE